MAHLQASQKYILILKSDNNYQKSNINHNIANSQNNQIFIWADGFEIKENGSIIFYQIAEQRKKIQVAAYGANKWENCLLISLNNDYCAFNQKSKINLPEIKESNQKLTPTQLFRKEEEEELNISNKSNKVNRFNEETSYFDNELELFTENTNNNNNNNNNSLINEELHVNNQNYLNNSNYNNIPIPGFNKQPNIDYKEIKNNFVEKIIKKYIQEHPAFDQEEFIKILNQYAHKENLKIEEDSALWAIANLIKKNKISSQKFFIIDKKNILDIYLKSILNRHWSGPDTKLSVILKMLQERDETKEISIVDLVSWLKYNKYFEK